MWYTAAASLPVVLVVLAAWTLFIVAWVAVAALTQHLEDRRLAKLGDLLKEAK